MLNCLLSDAMPTIFKHNSAYVVTSGKKHTGSTADSDRVTFFLLLWKIIWEVYVFCVTFKISSDFSTNFSWSKAVCQPLERCLHNHFIPWGTQIKVTNLLKIY